MATHTSLIARDRTSACDRFRLVCRVCLGYFCAGAVTDVPVVHGVRDVPGVSGVPDALVCIVCVQSVRVVSGLSGVSSVAHAPGVYGVCVCLAYVHDVLTVSVFSVDDMPIVHAVVVSGVPGAPDVHVAAIDAYSHVMRCTPGAPPGAPETRKNTRVMSHACVYLQFVII